MPADTRTRRNGLNDNDRHAEYTLRLHHPGAADKLRRAKGAKLGELRLRRPRGAHGGAQRRGQGENGKRYRRHFTDEPLGAVSPVFILTDPNNPIPHACASQPDGNFGATLAGAGMCLHIYFLSHLQFGEADRSAPV